MPEVSERATQLAQWVHSCLVVTLGRQAECRGRHC
jgi:hypothetical protein